MAETINPGRTGPSGDKIRKFARDIAKQKGEVDEKRGELGNLYKQLEESGVHKPAFKAALKLKGMDPTASDEWLRNFQIYLEDLGIRAQGQLNLGEPGAHTSGGDHHPTETPIPGIADAVTADENSDAYRQGEEAGAAGKSASLNTYPPGSVNNASWNSGWLKAQQAIAARMGQDAKPNGNGHAAPADKATRTKGRSAAAKKAAATKARKKRGEGSGARA